MYLWLDVLMLALALVAGWLGWVLLMLGGWRPSAALNRPWWATSGAPASARDGRVVNSQAVDGDC